MHSILYNKRTKLTQSSASEGNLSIHLLILF